MEVDKEIRDALVINYIDNKLVVSINYLVPWSDFVTPC